MAESEAQMSKSKKKNNKKRNPNSGIQYAVVNAEYAFRSKYGALIECTVVKRTRSEQEATEIFVQEYSKDETIYHAIYKVVNGKVDANYRNATVDYYYYQTAKFLSKELGVPVQILPNGAVCIGGDIPEPVYF